MESYCYKEDHAAEIIPHKSQSTNGLNIIYQHNLWLGLSFILEITLHRWIMLAWDLIVEGEMCQVVVVYHHKQ